MEISKLINEGSKNLKIKIYYPTDLDSEILLSKILNKSREKLLLKHLIKNFKKNELNLFNNLIKRRSKNEPIAYILKKRILE